MKYVRTFLLPALTITILGLSFPVSAEELSVEPATDASDLSASAGYELEPDCVYQLDLDGDGTTEAFSYHLSSVVNEDECSAQLDLYVDQTLVYSVTDDEWCYRWELCQCPLPDGRTALTAASISDNDWTNKALLIAQDPEEDTYSILADLTELTRSTEEADQLLSGWARMGSVIDADADSFTVSWTDSPYSTGIIDVPVTYQFDEGEITLDPQPSPLDDQKIWTAWKEFDVMDEPESQNLAFHVNAGDQVRLTAFFSIDGRGYLKCEDSDGQEGWFADPAEFIGELSEDGENYLYGYFEEAFFAG